MLCHLKQIQLDQDSGDGSAKAGTSVRVEQEYVQEQAASARQPAIFSMCVAWHGWLRADCRIAQARVNLRHWGCDPRRPSPAPPPTPVAFLT